MNITFIRNKISEIYKSDFVQKVLSMLFTRFLFILFSLINSIIISRILQPEGRGLYMLSVTIGLLGVQLGNLGLNNSNVYYVAKDRTLLRPLLINSFFISTVMGVICLCFYYFSIVYNFISLENEILFLAMIYIPFGLFYLFCQNILLGVQNIFLFNILDIIIRVLVLCITAFMIVFKKVTIMNLLILNSGITIFVSIYLGIYLLIECKKNYNKNYNIYFFKETLLYGTKSYIPCILAFLVYKVDVFILSYFNNFSQLGEYSIAISIMDTINLITTTVGSMLFSKLSSLAIVEEKYELCKKVNYYLLFINIIIIIMVIIFSKNIIRLLWGDEYISTYYILCYLVLSLIPLTFYNCESQLIASLGHSYLYSLLYVFSFVIKFVLSYFIIRNGYYLCIGISNLVVFFILSLGANILRKGMVKNA